MKKHMKFILLALMVISVAGCSTLPDKAAESEAKVTAADAASAIMAADAAMARAKERKSVWRDTGKILDQADNAMAADEYREARDLANRAREQAEAAVFQSYQGDAKFLIDSLRKDYMDQMYEDQKRRLESAATALEEDRVEVAYDTASLIMAELKAQMESEAEAPVISEAEVPMISEPDSASQSDTYTVKKKDNLWDIAAKPEVYGNSDMWPLLWMANKDKIKKPDELASGLSLVIDRNASEESIAAAIKYSKLRGAPSLGPVDAFDQKYLSR